MPFEAACSRRSNFKADLLFFTSMDEHMEQSKVMIGDKCAEIYTYESPDLVYAMNWSVRVSAS